MLDKGKGPKVLTAACKGWSWLLTFPRGALGCAARHAPTVTRPVRAEEKVLERQPGCTEFSVF